MIKDCIINNEGHLEIAGCDTVKLAKKYNTPLYVMDENKIRSVCKRYISALENCYGKGNAMPIYASKAFSCKEIIRVIHSENLDIEVLSGGELYTALQADVSGKNIHFNGSNKSYGELVYAVESDVSDIIVDNNTELVRLNEIAKEHNKAVNISLRIKPGVDPDTHEFIRTGQIDSKFGLAISNDEAFTAVKNALKLDCLNLTALHCHIGSQILEIEPFVKAAEVMIDFIKKIKDELNYDIEILNLGGGYGIRYAENDEEIPFEDYIYAVAEAIKNKCKEYKMNVPMIRMEPGRSIVAEAGTTLYTVGTIKEIPDVRNYVAVDGGMFDNPRYILYKADYECLIANKASEERNYKATIAGKCCESGDLIQENTMIQAPSDGDILAVLSTGAYNYSMSSNYNRNLKPACVMINNGEPRIIIKAETYEDLLRNDV